MDLPTFRSTFPEFSPTTYPDAAVTLWLNFAAVRMNASVWGELFDMGQGLYAAHNLALGQQQSVAASRGLAPGFATGMVTSKSVKDVALSYDAKTASIDGAGNYNLTTYGTRFWELADLVGQGGIQLGACFPLAGIVVDQFGNTYGNSVYGPVF